ncbi:MAG: Tim44/TimA family putative adaptor protein [Beijerinckiaceae bacterium]
MRDNFDATTIIFAAMAVFVLWKLWSVLGARTGNERPPYNPFAKGEPEPEAGGAAGNVVRLPGAAPSAAPGQNDNSADRLAGVAEPGSKVWEGLDAIAKADSSFMAASFVDGAKKAYEIIVLAFASGDRKTLKGLLAKDVFDSFSAAISTRESRNERVETTFVSLDKAVAEEAVYKAPAAQITIRFLAKLITVTRGSDGAIIDGAPDKVADMIDIWTFARDVNNRDPNWKLIATETGH